MHDEISTQLLRTIEQKQHLHANNSKRNNVLQNNYLMMILLQVWLFNGSMYKTCHLLMDYLEVQLIRG